MTQIDQTINQKASNDTNRGTIDFINNESTITYTYFHFKLKDKAKTNQEI